MATGDEIAQLLKISVSWEKLHQELAQRDRDALKREDEARQREDERHLRLLNMLSEVRDSMGDYHTGILTLPCQDVQRQLVKMAADIEALKRNTIPWRTISGWANRRTLAAVGGGLAGLLGWDSLRRTVETWWK